MSKEGNIPFLRIRIFSHSTIKANKSSLYWIGMIVDIRKRWPLFMLMHTLMTTTFRYLDAVTVQDSWHFYCESILALI